MILLWRLFLILLTGVFQRWKLHHEWLHHYLRGSGKAKRLTPAQRKSLKDSHDWWWSTSSKMRVSEHRVVSTAHPWHLVMGDISLKRIARGFWMVDHYRFHTYCRFCSHSPTRCACTVPEPVWRTVGDSIYFPWRGWRLWRETRLGQALSYKRLRFGVKKLKFDLSFHSLLVNVNDELFAKVGTPFYTICRFPLTAPEPTKTLVPSA